MFHVKRFTSVFIVLSLFLSTASFSQGSIRLTDKEFEHSHIKDTSITNALHGNKAFTSLSDPEKEAVYWINFTRLYPKRFCKEILLPFLEQFPEIKSSYTKSLVKDLNAVLPVPLILPAEKLNTIAHKHATDLGSNGYRISHNSSSGASFQKRMNEGGIFSCVAENIYEGKQRALQSVLFLLIDNGVPGLGHRKNILDQKMHSLGIAFYPIKSSSNYFSVQNFYCGDPL